jgi:hypothetical protein
VTIDNADRSVRVDRSLDPVSEIQEAPRVHGSFTEAEVDRRFSSLPYSQALLSVYPSAGTAPVETRTTNSRRHRRQGPSVDRGIRFSVPAGTLQMHARALIHERQRG